VALLYGERELCRREATRVFFRPLSDEEINRYIATGEPMDKAGAYGAQGLASLFVERLEGDFFNVVGLPLCALGEMLAELGFAILE
jgi:septum formation protein